MRFIYIANIRLPTEKAHGLQIMKMCESFSGIEDENSRLEVELVMPRRFNPIKEDPFEYYGVERSFKITHLPVLDFVKFGRVGFWIETLFFSKMAFFYLLFRRAYIIYGRDELPLYFLSFFHKNVFWEAHQGQINFAARRLLKKTKGVITISNGLRDFYVKNGADPEKILVVPDAVDFEIFDINLSKEEYRDKLDLPSDKKMVLYSGHLYAWKGADALLEAARNFQFPISNFQTIFVFVGGTEEEIKNYKLRTINYKLDNVFLIGHRSHSEIPLWLKAADLLVLPNSAKYELSKSFTSPMKLFEYMASGTPIIASDLPSIREIVSENEVLFFKPDDARDLEEKIKYAFQHEDEMRSKAGSTKQKVKNHTWGKRAEKIFSFITPRLSSEKSDFWPAVIAGAGIAVLSLPILKNIFVFDSIFSSSLVLGYALLVLWLVFVPIGAILGIYIAMLIGKKKPVVFQIAKYGLIGWLNVFMYAGIFNLISWFTGIASGFMADFFLMISFVFTTINSFFWNKLWTFGALNGDGHREYVKFFAITALTSLLNIFLFHLIVNTIGAPEGISEELWANIAIFGLIPVSFLGNFFGYKIFVFKS